MHHDVKLSAAKSSHKKTNISLPKKSKVHAHHDMQFTTGNKQSLMLGADAGAKMRTPPKSLEKPPGTLSTHYDVNFTAVKKRSQTPSTDAGSDGSGDSVDETTGREKYAPNRTNCSKAIVQSTSNAQTTDIEAEVIREIRNQLRHPENNQGYVWVDQTYLRIVGPLRTFLEKHPDKFVIQPKGGKGFRVAEAVKAGRPNSRR
jgi:hypothetical protein